MNPFIKKHQDAFWRDLTTFGGFLFYLLVTILAVLLREREIAFNLISGFGLTFLAILLIRTFYYKDRPRKEEHHTFIQRIDACSFPSWHMARILFMALIIGKGTMFLTTFFMMVALLVGYSRIYLKKHDWIDVVSGGVLAIAVYGVITFM